MCNPTPRRLCVCHSQHVCLRSWTAFGEGCILVEGPDCQATCLCSHICHEQGIFLSQCPWSGGVLGWRQVSPTPALWMTSQTGVFPERSQSDQGGKNLGPCRNTAHRHRP